MGSFEVNAFWSLHKTRWNGARHVSKLLFPSTIRVSPRTTSAIANRKKVKSLAVVLGSRITLR